MRTKLLKQFVVYRVSSQSQLPDSSQGEEKDEIARGGKEREILQRASSGGICTVGSGFECSHYAPVRP